MVVSIETSIVFDSRARNELPILLEGAQLTRDSVRSKKGTLALNPRQGRRGGG